MFDLVTAIADFVLRIDRHLVAIRVDYGGWTYAILFLIVFAQTGLVATPLLPGNSLLVAAGFLCTRDDLGLEVNLVASALSAGAILGNLFNYGLGARFGPALFRREEAVIVRRRHLERAQVFFETHGGRTVLFAPFVPLARTFVPFAAGVLHLPVGRFLAGSLVGGLGWCVSLTYAGYALGRVSGVKDNFDTIIAGLVLTSVLPLGWAGWNVWRVVRRERSGVP